MKTCVQFVASICLAHCGFAQTTRIYSICELLASPRSFQGAIVSVKGIAVGSEGAWLSADSCGISFVVGDLSLVKALFLSYRSETGRKVNRNSTHIKTVELELARRWALGVKDIELVYTGVFETRESWVVLKDSGRGRIWGLGHDNAFPAQLVITDISDPRDVPGGRRGSSK